MNKGQSIIEFVIVPGLIAVVAILALTLLGQNVNNIFKSSTEKAMEYRAFDYS